MKKVDHLKKGNKTLKVKRVKVQRESDQTLIVKKSTIKIDETRVKEVVKITEAEVRVRRIERRKEDRQNQKKIQNL